MTDISNWLHNQFQIWDQSVWEGILLWVSIISLIALAGTVLILPWAVTQLPVDYFTGTRRQTMSDTSTHPALKLLLLILKNTLGLLLLILGFIMLFIPGQGLLTILAGLALMNFPGKYKLERALIKSPGVIKGINWIRERRGYPPMAAPE
ncbi:MAG: PGPGW domain-containing protein [Parahaliea sp.]